jgi:SnoaL-like domain
VKTAAITTKPECRTLDLVPALEIDGIHETTIYEYFRRLDRGDFEATANLFADGGCLNPPFEKSIVGREAIAQYLSKEAIGMSFRPECGQLVESDLARMRYQIQGKVVTNYFTVSVGWSIELNADREITIVGIKLLASMSELLTLRS